MNFDLLEVELDLCSQWPCRRRRWWALLLPKQWHSTGLHSWPHSSLFTNIGSVIGNWPAWPADEEASLLLDSVEINRYTDPSLGHDKRELSLDDISPTAMATPSKPVLATAGFKDSRKLALLRKGFVASSCEPIHLACLAFCTHHKEAAILLGVPSDIQYVLPPRANLALLGLIASPLQSTWVYASLLANFAQATNAIQPISPRAAIQSLQDRLLCQWRLQQPQTAPAHISLTVHRSDGPEVLATTFATATADSVMLAERIYTEWGSTTKLTQLHNEHCTTAVWTHQRRKKQRILPPTQPVDICIIHEEVLHCTTVAAGSFLFEPLRHLGISANFLWQQIAETTAPSANVTQLASDLTRLLGSTFGGLLLADSLRQASVASASTRYSKHQPWTELKAKANTPATMFRLVLPSELSAHVQARSQSQFGAAISTDKKKSKGKGERRPRPTPAQPDPADLSLFADSFVDAKQLAVPPLPFHAVTADARGVAICTAQQALPFIKAGKRISPEALALVVNEPVEAPVGAEIAPLIFPAQYQGTGEPVLLRGAILQLGDIAVSRKAANVMPQPEVVHTQVLRIQVYRDLFDQWDTFAEELV
ncbi:unnamed protein product, partial [Effrenium voratum]